MAAQILEGVVFDWVAFLLRLLMISLYSHQVEVGYVSLELMIVGLVGDSELVLGMSLLVQHVFPELGAHRVMCMAAVTAVSV